jgi:hypothetical protein
VDVNRAAGHSLPTCPGVAADENLTVRHLCADPVDTARLPSNSSRPSEGSAGDIEELGERHLAVAVKDLEPLDLRQRHRANADGVRPSTSTGIDVCRFVAERQHACQSG